MEIGEIIQDNPYSPSPRGNVSDFGQLVGREEIMIDFWNFVHQASKKKFIPVIIRAPYGGGKTTLLRWVRKTMEARQNLPEHILNKNILSVYTKLPHPSIRAITSTFLDEARLCLDKQKRDRLQGQIQKVADDLSEKKIESENVLQTLLYRSALDALYGMGFDVILHIIDEFEAISEISAEESRGFLHEFRDFIDEIGERPLVMALGCTDEAYRMMEEIHPALVSRVPDDFRRQVDTKLNFTLENALDFVAKKIESVRSENPDATNPYFPFERGSIQLLYERTGGNIRMIEQVCYFALEKARKDNKRIDSQVLLEALHQVISQKKGVERTKSVLNLIDDPKQRESLAEKIRNGNPDDLKSLLFSGFQVFLMRQSFDYQFQREDNSLGERAGIARIQTHAYRTIPVDVVFLPTTVPEEFGHSDLVDVEKIEKSQGAGLGIVLRLAQEVKQVKMASTNVLSVSIPWSRLEELAALPNLSHLDAEKVSRGIEEDLGITSSVNAWIREKIAEGKTVGERFRQYEGSIYIFLWRLGEGAKTIDQIFHRAKKIEKKFSKVTLIARLRSLEEKGLVKAREDKFEWTISQVMKEICRAITEEFKGNPVTAMDLKQFFVGGSIDTLLKYMQLMEKIGILSSVRVGRHTAYKTRDVDALLQEALESRNTLKQLMLERSKLPNPTRVEIQDRETHFQDSLKEAKEAVQANDQLKALVSSFRAKCLVEEVKRIVEGLKDQTSLIERQNNLLLNKIERTEKYVEECHGLGIDVSQVAAGIRGMKRELGNTYDNNYKVRGKTAEAAESLSSIQSQLDTFESDLAKTLEMHQKLIQNLEKSKELIESIEKVSMGSAANEEDLKKNVATSKSLLLDAETALKNREFTRAEFLLLKILQNEGIRQVIFRMETKLSEVSVDVEQVSELSSVVGRISPESNILTKVQQIRTWIQEGRLSLGNSRLREAIDKIEMVREHSETLRGECMATLASWFSNALSKGGVTTTYELSRVFNVPHDTVLQGAQILLKNSKIGIAMR